MELGILDSKPLTGIFLIVGSERCVILPNKIFSSKFVFDLKIDILVLNIGHILFILLPAKRVNFFDSPGRFLRLL